MNPRHYEPPGSVAHYGNSHHKHAADEARRLYNALRTALDLPPLPVGACRARFLEAANRIRPHSPHCANQLRRWAPKLRPEDVPGVQGV